MRRILGGLAVFLGILALVLGMRADSIYDQLATVPLDQKTTAESEGTGVSALRVSAEGGSVRFDKLTDQHVKNTRTIIGLPGKVPEGQRDDNAFWQIGLRTEIVDGQPLSLSTDGVSINRRTGLATNCCGDFVGVGTTENQNATQPITHEGLFFKFPFDAQKKSYPFWDGELKAARDAAFVREEKVKGLDTYVYEQTIPTTRLPGSRTVPRTMFGSGTGNVQVQSDYANTRTFWVEPNTGAIIRAQENINREAVSEAGTVTLIKGVIGYNDKTQQKFAEEYGDKAGKLAFVRDLLGPIGFVAGALLTLLGLFLLFARGRGEHRDSRRDDLVAADREATGATRA